MVFSGLVLARVVIQLFDLLGIGLVGVLAAMAGSRLSGESSIEIFGLTLQVSGNQDFVAVLAGIIVVFLAKTAIGAALLLFTTRFLAGIESDSASRVAAHIFSGNMERVRSMTRGEIQWAVSASSRVAFATMLFSGATLITESALFIAIFVGFVLVDPSLAIAITLYFGILVLIFQTVINKGLKRLGQRTAQYSERVNDSILDLVGVFREAMVQHKVGEFVRTFSRARSRLARDEGVQKFIMGSPRYFVEAALMLGAGTLVLFQLSQESLTDGLVGTSVFIAGGTRMMGALLPFQNAISVIRVDGPKAARAHHLIEEAVKSQTGQEENLPSRNAQIPRGPVRVSLQNVTFAYAGAAQPAVSGISLSVEPGQFAALIGPSGSGKSTIADLMLGVLSPGEGEVQLDEHLPQTFIRRGGRLAYLPQRPGLISGTIAQNVALGFPDAEVDPDRVHESLEMTGLMSLVDELPDGIGSSIGSHLDAISVGQAQRLGLARALYNQPQLLLVDEATSALDPDAEKIIGDTLKSLHQKVTIVTIAHRLHTVQDADVIFVIERGSLIHSGSFSEVKQEVPMVARYVELSSFSN